MQEQKYVELEERVSLQAEEAIPADMTNAMLRKLETRHRIHQEIEAMRAEGKALTLTDEEIDLLQAFRRFKLRMRKDGEIFNWQSRKPEGVQIVQETAEIVHPQEALANVG
jgi:uncharacterized protein YecA (UPF0149 family)